MISDGAFVVDKAGVEPKARKKKEVSAKVRPGSESRADVYRVSREHGRAYCFPHEKKPETGQLVEQSPGIPEVSHQWCKRNNETREGIQYERRAKLGNEQRQS